MGIRRSVFGAVDPTLVVVEGLENQRRPELTLVDQIYRLLVVRIDAHREAGQDLLDNSRIEEMIAFGRRGSVAERWRGAGGGAEFFDRLDRHQLGRRRRELSRVSRMQRGALE